MPYVNASVNAIVKMDRMGTSTDLNVTPVNMSTTTTVIPHISGAASYTDEIASIESAMQEHDKAHSHTRQLCTAGICWD